MALTLKTELTELLGIKNPIILAGMNKAAGPTLAATVSNEGGLGVIGGVFFTPRILKATIKEMKSKLIDKNAPFGVDLLIPKVGSTARKTNYDYTKGKLNDLIDIIIESGAKLFVCAVGVPPKEVVQKLHKNNVLVMNIIGAPKHVNKALAQGVDIICAQGGEGGGHTGSVPTSILLPKVVDLCKNRISSFTKKPIYVVGAGGIYNGRGLAMALSYGCQAVWIGTRFVASHESGAPLAHKKAIVEAGYTDTQKTLVYTGRPLRVIKNDYIQEWATTRKNDLRYLLKNGVVPVAVDIPYYLKRYDPKFKKYAKYQMSEAKVLEDRHLTGSVAASINDILPAKDIIKNIMNEAIETILQNNKYVQVIQSKL